ncbi:hypothetical protein XENOCAPTIV_020513, partial [Xenoophorus captivus]
VSTQLIQEGQRQVLILDLMEEDQKLLETLFTQSAESTDKILTVFLKVSVFSSADGDEEDIYLTVRGAS